MRPVRVLLLGMTLLLWTSRVHAVEPYLPPHSAFTTWQDLYRDQVYQTTKWYEAAMFSAYEQCRPSPGSTVLTAYPRPSDGQYCYYWSLYMHNRALTWMIVNAGLALGTLTCETQRDVDSSFSSIGKEVDLTCAALQRDFGLFTTTQETR